MSQKNENLQESSEEKSLRNLVKRGEDLRGMEEDLLENESILNDGERTSDERKTAETNLRDLKRGVRDCISGGEDYADVLFTRTGLGRGCMDKCRDSGDPKRDYPFGDIEYIKKRIKEKNRVDEYEKDRNFMQVKINLESFVRNTYSKCEELGDFYAYDKLKELIFPLVEAGVIGVDFEKEERNESRKGEVEKALKAINPEYQGDPYEISGKSEKVSEEGAEILARAEESAKKRGEEFSREISTVAGNLNLEGDVVEEVQKEVGLEERKRNWTTRIKSAVARLRTITIMGRKGKKEAPISVEGGKEGESYKDLLRDLGRNSYKDTASVTDRVREYAENVWNLVFMALNPENGKERKELKNAYPELYEILSGKQDWHPDISDTNSEEKQEKFQEKQDQAVNLSKVLVEGYQDYMNLKKKKENESLSEEDKRAMIRLVSTIKEQKKSLGVLFREVNKNFSEKEFLQIYESAILNGSDSNLLSVALQGELSWITKYASMSRQTIKERIKALDRGER